MLENWDKKFLSHDGNCQWKVSGSEECPIVRSRPSEKTRPTAKHRTLVTRYTKSWCRDDRMRIFMQGLYLKNDKCKTIKIKTLMKVNKCVHSCYLGNTDKDACLRKVAAKAQEHRVAHFRKHRLNGVGQNASREKRKKEWKTCVKYNGLTPSL